MQLNYILFTILGAGLTASATPTPVEAAAPKWSFSVYQQADCSDDIVSVNPSGSSSQFCQPPLAYSFRAVKVFNNNGGKCTISFLDACPGKALIRSPGKIKANGACFKLPSGIQTYNVTCT